jgi:putative colanic acid biosynthesis UDP-glucose lipid carrier transferase
MTTRNLYIVYTVISIVDLLIINGAFIYCFNYEAFAASDSLSQLLVINYLWFFSAFYSSLYGPGTKVSLQGRRLIFESTVIFSFLFLPFMILLKGLETMLLPGLCYLIIVFIGLLANRYLYSLSENVLGKYFKLRRSVAVLGNSSTALQLAGFFKNSNYHFAFDGFVNENGSSYMDEDGQLLPSVLFQLEAAAASGVKEIYVSLELERLAEFQALQTAAYKRCLRVKLISDVPPTLLDNLSISYIGGLPVLSNHREPLEDIEHRIQKRLFDIAFSLLVIIFVMSWLYPIISILIKLQSPGPVIFKQLRSGKDNNAFTCFKFRSMIVNAGEKQATKMDARITPIGRFLRRTSLDELPQFFNVLLGDMSVVGPRPHILTMTDEYSKLIDHYMVRHFLKSGITGWAQVNGFRGETKDLSSMERRVEHDIWYLENWSMLLDIKIIFMTIFQHVKGDENAY